MEYLRMVTMTWGFVSFIHSMAAVVSTAPDIDNGVIGEPLVECSVDSIQVRLGTKNPFKGNVFVRGHYADPQCRGNHSSNGGGIGGSNISITIVHGTCPVQRQRMIAPEAMQMQMVIMVSFHPLFVTGVDRAYNIRCMYREGRRTVSTGMEASALTTAALTYTFPTPQCSYTLRKDEIDGEILRYAKVGDLIVHRWQCETDTFGMLVHSCYVDDGQGQRVYVVDEQGCHTDRDILGDPTYVEHLDMAYRESHVFKFADRLTVRFQCQIRLCVKVDDGCSGITPPMCHGPSEAETILAGNGTSVNGTGLWSSPGVRRRPRRTELDPFMPELHGDIVSQDIYVLENSASGGELGTHDGGIQSLTGASSSTDWSLKPIEMKQEACLSFPLFVTVLSLLAAAQCLAGLLCFQLIRNRRCGWRSCGEDIRISSKDQSRVTPG